MKPFVGKSVIRRVWVTMVVAAAAFGLIACAAKPSTRTPSGALQLMLKAAKARDAAKMKTFCKGVAVDQCDQLLAAIAKMEEGGKASKFDSWNASTGPAPSGSRSNAYADLYGVSHDLFMRVSVTLERDGEGPWKVDQMIWESKREE